MRRGDLGWYSEIESCSKHPSRMEVDLRAHVQNGICCNQLLIESLEDIQGIP